MDQGNKCLKMRGTEEQKAYWGTWTIETIQFRGIREQVPPLGGPSNLAEPYIIILLNPWKYMKHLLLEQLLLLLIVMRFPCF